MHTYLYKNIHVFVSVHSVDPTNVEVTPSSVVVYKGQDFSLHCNETHDDNVTVELVWIFDGKEVESTDDRRSLTYSQVEREGREEGKRKE